MKVKLTHSLGIVLALSVGVMCGVALQEYYDVGNLFKALGVGCRPILAPPTLAVEDSIPEGLQGKLSLFILAGQSNIAGRGKVPESGQSMGLA